MIQRLAHVHVVERLNRGVEADVTQCVLRAGKNIGVLALVHTVDVGNLQAAVQVDVAGFKVHRAGGALGHNLKNNILKRSSFPPVGIVALKGNAFAGNPVANLKGTGADRRAAMRFFAHIGDRLFVHNAHDSLAKLSFKESIGFRGFDLHSIIVNCFQAGEVDMREGARAGRCGCKAVERVHNVLCSEVFAVGEIHILTQFELPGGVIKGFPLSCKVWLRGGSLVKLEQSIHGVHHHDLGHVAHHAAGVQRRGFAVHRNVDGILVGDGFLSRRGQFRVCRRGFFGGSRIGGRRRIGGGRFARIGAPGHHRERHREHKDHCQILFHVVLVSPLWNCRV